MQMDRVEAHYDTPGLLDAIRGALVRAGKELDALEPDDLAPVDEFHIRGREATVELAALAEVAPGSRVVDIGSGLGGTARYLAHTHGCNVSGIDLTASFCDAATELSAMVGLADRTRFSHGSALALPFDDASFDVAWTEHVQMNIADKATFYGEAARVLAPSGRLVFHDIFLGGGGEPHFPAPWAEDASLSAMCTADEARDAIESAGFEVRAWIDRTAPATTFFEAMLERVAAAGPPPLGLHLVVQRDFALKVKNLVRSLREGRVVAVQSVCVKPRG